VIERCGGTEPFDLFLKTKFAEKAEKIAIRGADQMRNPFKVLPTDPERG
jgi:hypothetical protein